MNSARHVLPAALAPAVRLAPLTPEKVDFAWRAASGPAIAKATRVSLGDSGVLAVRSDDARWADEIHRLRHDLVRSLEPWLGRGVVSRIDIEGRTERASGRRRGAKPDATTSGD